MIHISDRLRSLIAEKNLSRKDVCDASGLSESALSNYLNGRTPQSLESIVALADFLGVSLDYLILGKEPELSYNELSSVENALIQHTIQMEQRVERHNDLFLRVLNAFRSDLGKYVSQEVKKNDLFNTSLITEEDVWNLEMCANTVVSATPSMVDEIRLDNSQLKPGQYYNYIRDNYRLNEDVAYVFYVNNQPALPDKLEERFREILACDHVRPKRRTKHRTAGTLKITTVDVPIYTQIVMYRLRLGAVRDKNPILYERIQNFIADGDMIGIILAPSVESQINILMDEEHFQFARQFIQHLERHSSDEVNFNN